MERFRFFQPPLLKISFLLSLLVILFLLNSPIFQPPGNIPLANFIQSVNSVLSRPLIMLENFTHLHMHWVATAFCILVFWFVVFYLVLLLISSRTSEKA